MLSKTERDGQGAYEDEPAQPSGDAGELDPGHFAAVSSTDEPDRFQPQPLSADEYRLANGEYSELTRLTEENARLTRELGDSRGVARARLTRADRVESDAMAKVAVATETATTLRAKLAKARKALRDQARGLKRLSDKCKHEMAAYRVQLVDNAELEAVKRENIQLLLQCEELEKERDAANARVRELEAAFETSGDGPIDRERLSRALREKRAAEDRVKELETELHRRQVKPGEYCGKCGERFADVDHMRLCGEDDP